MLGIAMRAAVVAAWLLSLAQGLPPGKLIDKVTCYGDPQQSYALYLPSGYAPTRQWPILYCFDPGARGRVPLERFHEAAERYGWIVVGSNNSRNGPLEVSVSAMDAMWRDTHARFAIDPRRIYAAGFSGGARMACRLGLAGELVAGVIACGGGFPGPDLPRKIPFVFFGTGGTEDFNGPEVKQLDRELDPLGVRHRIVTYEGGHDWLAAPLALEALEWMELEAMKSGRRSNDDAWIEQLFRRRAAQAHAAEAAGRVPDAWVAHAALAEDFRGLRDIAAFEKKAMELAASKAVKAFLKREEDQERKRQQGNAEVYEYMEGLRDPREAPFALGAVRSSVARLRRKMEDKEDSPDRRAARQVVGGLSVAASEDARDLLRQKQYVPAALRFEVVAATRPDRPAVLFEAGCAYAQAGEKNKALDALKRAVEKGFKDLARLKEDSRLAALRHEAGFTALLAKIVP